VPYAVQGCPNGSSPNYPRRRNLWPTPARRPPYDREGRA
jgi:hypothetical protein